MKLNDIQFFYINCKKDHFKNNLILSQWEKCCEYADNNIKINRWDAVHFEDYNLFYFLNSYGVSGGKIDGQPSNVAVWKSHTNLWKYILHKKYKYAFIFEDDVTIPKSFLKDLEEILYDTPDNWDTLHFGILRMMAKKSNSGQFHKMLPRKGYNNGLHAYMVNSNSVKKMLATVLELGASNQIDIMLRDNADNFNFFIYEKLLIKQNVDNLESTRLGRFVKPELKQNFDEINIVV